MKKYLFILVVLPFFLSNTYSQIGLSLGPMLGITSPTVDYTGETTDFYSGTRYGVRTGFNYGALGKIRLGPLNAKLTISFSSLTNSGQAEIDKPNSKVDVKHSMFIFGIGTEFGFNVPASPIKPYIGVDFLFTSFSGDVTFQGTSKVPSGTFSIQSSSRTGLGFCGGLQFKLAGVTSMDLSLHYNLHNLFGKEYKTNTDRLGVYTSLNDLKDPNYSASDDKHPIGNDRSIATIQIQLGILFGF